MDIASAKRTSISNRASKRPWRSSYRFETPGDHVAEVRLAADALDVDNHRWLALPVKDQLRVLCVDGKPAGGGLSGASDYLALALNPDQGESAPPRWSSPRSLPKAGWSSAIWPITTAYFSTTSGSSPPAKRSLLDAYLKQGGGLVFFLGDQVLPDRYNRELLRDGGGVSAGPHRRPWSPRDNTVSIRSTIGIRWSRSSRTANRRVC